MYSNYNLCGGSICAISTPDKRLYVLNCTNNGEDYSPSSRPFDRDPTSKSSNLQQFQPRLSDQTHQGFSILSLKGMNVFWTNESDTTFDTF